MRFPYILGIPWQYVTLSDCLPTESYFGVHIDQYVKILMHEMLAGGEKNPEN